MGQIVIVKYSWDILQIINTYIHSCVYPNPLFFVQPGRLRTVFKTLYTQTTFLWDVIDDFNDSDSLCGPIEFQDS